MACKANAVQQLFGLPECKVQRERAETLELKLLDEQWRTEAAQRRADEYHRSNVAKDAEIRRLTAALEEAQENPAPRSWYFVTGNHALNAALREREQSANLAWLEGQIRPLETLNLGLQRTHDSVKAENTELQRRNDTQAETIKGLQEDLEQARETIIGLLSDLGKAKMARDEARARAWAEHYRGNVYFNQLNCSAPYANDVDSRATDGACPKFPNPKGSA